MADASEVPAALTKEVGAGKFKLPLYLWVLAGAAGLYVARGIRSRQQAAATDTTDTTDLNAGSDSAFGAGLGANGAVIVGGGGFDSGTSSTITDNDAWRKAAVNFLVSQNYDALAAARAIDKYLSGDPLGTRANQIMVEAALRRLGPTPEPVPAPIGTPPTPKPPPTPPPPKPKPAGGIQQDRPLHVVAAPKNASEHFVDFANTQDGRGTWWLTNLGGIYSAGAAPFYGSPIGVGERRSNWSVISSRYPSRGYRCNTSDGHARTFG